MLLSTDYAQNYANIIGKALLSTDMHDSNACSAAGKT